MNEKSCDVTHRDVLIEFRDVLTEFPRDFAISDRYAEFYSVKAEQTRNQRGQKKT